MRTAHVSESYRKGSGNQYTKKNRKPILPSRLAATRESGPETENAQPKVCRKESNIDHVCRPLPDQLGWLSSAIDFAFQAKPRNSQESGYVPTRKHMPIAPVCCGEMNGSTTDVLELPGGHGRREPARNSSPKAIPREYICSATPVAQGVPTSPMAVHCQKRPRRPDNHSIVSQLHHTDRARREWRIQKKHRAHPEFRGLQP